MGTKEGVKMKKLLSDKKLAFFVFLLGLLPFSLYAGINYSVDFKAKITEEKLFNINDIKSFNIEKEKYLYNAVDGKLHFWYRINNYPTKNFLNYAKTRK